MRRNYFLLPLLALAAAAFSSCSSSDLAVVSKERARSSIGSWASFGGGQAALPTPATVSIQASASSRPKDKHGMPVYKFTDRNRLVRTTAYTCSESDHIQYGSKNAVGTQLLYTSRVRSAAADWSVYPVGTLFRIKGLPYLYVVDDYGSALVGTQTVDIYHPSRDLMNYWGRRNVELTVVRWGSFEQSAQLLSKRTHYPHCSQMYTSIQRLRAGASMASTGKAVKPGA